MGNTQEVWILYGIVLTLAFLIADEQTIGAKIHQIIKTTKLNQPLYLKKMYKIDAKICYIGEEVKFLFSQKTKNCAFNQN